VKQVIVRKNGFRLNCAKMATDRPRQPAYKIFSMSCRFQQSKSGPSRFKEACARGCQRWVPQPVKNGYLSSVGLFSI